MSKLRDALREAGCTVDYEEPLGLGSARIKGEWRGKSYMIDYTLNQSLILSAGDFPGWKKVLSALRPICTKFIQADALCQYDAKVAQWWTHYMEWQLQNPEEYLRQLVNGGGTPGCVQSRNLILLGDRKLADYEDADLKAAYAEGVMLRTSFAGVYGKDPGNCDLTRLKKASNLGLFLEYSAALSALVDLSHQSHQATFTEDLVTVMTYGATLAGLLRQRAQLTADFILGTICQRNQIPTSTPSKTQRLQPDETLFLRWNNFYGNHLQQTLSDQELTQLVDDYFQGKDISHYAPQGNWREYNVS